MSEILDRARFKIKKALSKSFSVSTAGHYFEQGHDLPTLNSQKSYMDRYNFSDLLPYESYDEEHGIYFNEDSIGFCIETSPATSMTESDFKVLEGILSSDHVPGSTIQFTTIADSNVDGIYENWKHARTKNSGDSSFGVFKGLSERRIEYLTKGKYEQLFKSTPFLVRNFRLIISFTVPVTVGARMSDFTLSDIEEHEKKRESIIQSLKTAGMHSKIIEPAALINLVSSLFHPSDKKKSNIEYDENRLIKDQMVSSEIALMPYRDGLSLITKDKNVSILPWSVRQFPKYWKGSASTELIGAFMDNIRQIPCPFVTTLAISFPDAVGARSRIKNKSLHATKMADSQMARFVPQWKERSRDLQFVSDKLQNGSALVNALYQVILFAPQGKEEACEKALDGLYDGYGWRLQKDRWIPIPSLLTFLPMGFGRELLDLTEKLKRFRVMLSWNAINMAPIFGEPRGDDNPCLLMHGRRGQTLNINPYDNGAGNFNIACAAASGAGKSFFTHEMIFSVLGQKGKVFVIDSGRSYEQTVQLLDGTYLDFGDKSRQIVLNPFTNIDDITEQLPLLIIIICNCASPDTPLNPVQKTAIEKAVTLSFKKHGKDSTMTLVAEELILADNLVSLELAEMIYPYTRDGMYGAYFEGPSNMDFDNRFVVLELDDLAKKPELQEVVLLILMLNINESFYHSDRSQKKLCIIDEAWRLLTGNAGQFIEEGYRVVRKYGGSFMTVTQSVADYYKSPVAQAAYANADHVWLLRQKTSQLLKSIEEKQIDGSGGQAALLKSLKTEKGMYSEIAFISPAGIAVGRLIVDKVTEKLYSTKAEEVQFLKNKQKEGVPIMAALEQLADLDKSR